MPGANETIRAEVLIDTSSLEAKLSSLEQRAKSIGASAGSAGGRITGGAVGAPAWRSLMEPDADWNWRSINEPDPIPFGELVQPRMGRTSGGRSDPARVRLNRAQAGLLARLRGIARQQTRGAIAAGVAWAVMGGLQEESSEDGIGDRLGGSFGRVFGTAGAALAFSGGNPAVAALSGVGVLITEIQKNLKEYRELGPRGVIEAAKEAEKQRQREFNRLIEEIRSISREATDIRVQASNDLARLLYEHEQELEEEMYQAARSVTYTGE